MWYFEGGGGQKYKKSSRPDVICTCPQPYYGELVGCTAFLNGENAGRGDVLLLRPLRGCITR